MKFQVFLHPKANDFLEKLDEDTKKRLLNKIKELEGNKHKGRQLTHLDCFSLRVGDYRVIYEIHDKEKRIVVLFIGHRRNVYDDFSKLI